MGMSDRYLAELAQRVPSQPRSRMVRIECDEDQNCVLVCPACNEWDTIYEQDVATRSNQITVEVHETVGVRRLIGHLGDGSPEWVQDETGFYCNHCLVDHLELPLKVSDYR